MLHSYMCISSDSHLPVDKSSTFDDTTCKVGVGFKTRRAGSFEATIVRVLVSDVTIKQPLDPDTPQFASVEP
jgi:hypothetical protein